MDRARSSRLGRALLHRTHVQSHPRLFGAGAAAILIYLLLSAGQEPQRELLIAFDGGAAVFLAAVWVMMATANPEGMRRRAELEDEGRYTVLTLSLVAAIASGEITSDQPATRHRGRLQSEPPAGFEGPKVIRCRHQQEAAQPLGSGSFLAPPLNELIPPVRAMIFQLGWAKGVGIVIKAVQWSADGYAGVLVVELKQMIPPLVLVMPAKAGTQGGQSLSSRLWTPAFAGATGDRTGNHLSGSHH